MPRALDLALEIIEDDYDWDSEDNVVLDPKGPLVVPDLQAMNSNDIGAIKGKLNDIREILGVNKQGGKAGIKNYAPRTMIDPANMPFPTEPKAKEYGVRRERVEQFD